MAVRPARILVLLAGLACADAGLGCGSPPPSAGAASAPCSLPSLFGEWVGDDGARIRIIDSRDRGFTLLAVRLQDDGREGGLVYSRLRQMGICRFSASRHVDLDPVLHPAPPQRVTLALDPATGVLVDDYADGTPLRWRRVTTK